MINRPRTEPLAPDVDVASLRVEPSSSTAMEDHFCPVCDCMKSGWADVPNHRAEWCVAEACRCHEEDQNA